MRNFLHLFLCAVVAGCSSLPTTPIPIAPVTNNQAVVFDIDGTLTPTVLAISTVRPYAAEVANAYARKGYRIFYVSARDPRFQSGVPSFLRYNGFPEGSFHLPTTKPESENPADYKVRVLTDLHKVGWRFSYAYGDQDTDAIAYSTPALGIAPERIFGLRLDGKGSCAPKFSNTQCLKGWEEHVNFVASIPRASGN
jgi:hypothetical protein